MKPPRRPAKAISVVPPCPVCGACHTPAAIAANQQVCPSCDHHYRIGARARLELLLDRGTYEEWDPDVTARDPLSFVDDMSYPERVRRAQGKTGTRDAVLTGSGLIDAHPVGIACMEFGFIGGSMGEVVGERIARAMERSAARAMPFVAVTASGGARMQEGIHSLMQMAKTSVARGRLAEVPVPYICVLADPTMGGVMSSFAATADVILAEPGAMIGFAGKRVINQATHEELPAGFQTAEFTLEHGFVDRVVHRRDLAAALARLIDLYPVPISASAAADLRHVASSA